MTENIHAGDTVRIKDLSNGTFIQGKVYGDIMYGLVITFIDEAYALNTFDPSQIELIERRPLTIKSVLEEFGSDLDEAEVARHLKEIFEAIRDEAARG